MKPSLEGQLPRGLVEALSLEGLLLEVPPVEVV
jgi:hypothetical protein